MRLATLDFVPRFVRSVVSKAMPPKARKKLGYNWKARQSGHGGRSSCRGFVASRTGPRTSQSAEDTNALVLPSNPKKQIEEVVDRGSKRKRLSAKQRKRLMKVLEVKEMKKRVRSY